MQIIGEYKIVRSALIQLTSSLRSGPSLYGMRNEVRTRSPYIRVNEAGPTKLYQPIGTGYEASEKADITRQMNQLGLSHSNGTSSPGSLLSQVYYILSFIFHLSL